MNRSAIAHCTKLDDNDYKNVLDDVHRFLEGGNAGAAVRAISRHLARHPDSAEAHNDMAVLLHAAGEPECVLDHARRASELDPSNSQYTANYATVLVELGRWQEALAALTTVVAAAPLDSAARALLKQVQVAACGRSEAAAARGRWEAVAGYGAKHAQPSGTGANGDAIARPKPKGIRRELRVTANALREKRVLVIAPRAHFRDPEDDDGSLTTANPNLCWFDPSESPRPSTRLPFESGTFGAVLGVGMIDARTDLERVSAEIRRVLCPNGILRFQLVSSRSQTTGSSKDDLESAVRAAFAWDPRLCPIHRARGGDAPHGSLQTTLFSNLESLTSGVSVLMPVRNTPVAHCEQAIRSILTQTHDALEFVIVDDCSTDPIVNEYLASLVERDARIRLVHTTESKGLAHALNVGLRACTGSVVVRMDSDDIARPLLIEKQVDFFASHPEAVVCGVQIRFFGDVNGETHHPAIVDRWSALNRTDFRLTNHPGVGLRRDAILSLGAYGTTRKGRAEDYELWCRVLADGWVIQNQSEVLLDHRSVNRPERSGRTWIEYLEKCRDVLR